MKNQSRDIAAIRQLLYFAAMVLLCSSSLARAQPVPVSQFVAPNGRCESSDTLFLQAESVAPFGIPMRRWSDRDFNELVTVGSRCIANENGGPSDSLARTLINQFEGKVRALSANARGLQAKEAAKQRQHDNALVERERRLEEREMQMSEQETAAEGKERYEAALAARQADQAQTREAGIAKQEKRVAEFERQAAERTRQIDELQLKEAELARREQQAQALDGPVQESALPQLRNDPTNHPLNQGAPTSLNLPSDIGSASSDLTKSFSEHISTYRILVLIEYSLTQCVAEFASYDGDRRKVSSWLHDSKKTGLAEGIPEKEFDDVKGKLTNDPNVAVMQSIRRYQGKGSRKRECDNLSAKISLIEIARRSDTKK